jgi:hypothetical protein
VLDTRDYERIASAFASSMRTGVAEKVANYDADIIAVTRILAPVFAPFFSASWIEAMHRVVGFPNRGRVDGALHSSAPGSRTGWIHSDFCSAWFDESETAASGPFFPNRAACDYYTGKIHVPTARPKEYVRAATLIYYLCNDGWQSGDGGETALYSSGRGGSRTAVQLVPPLNNSLLLFPCSPHSYHRFITNPGRRRNSIILWVHATVEDACAEWGSGVKRRSAA